jgi:hypothetical protein
LRAANRGGRGCDSDPEHIAFSCHCCHCCHRPCVDQQHSCVYPQARVVVSYYLGLLYPSGIVLHGNCHFNSRGGTASLWSARYQPDGSLMRQACLHAYLPCLPRAADIPTCPGYPGQPAPHGGLWSDADDTNRQTQANLYTAHHSPAQRMLEILGTPSPGD